MLRRKFLVVFGLLVLLLVGLAVAAMWMLQGILADLDHFSEATHVVDQASKLGEAVSTAQVELHQLHVGVERDLDGLVRSTRTARELLDDLGIHYVARAPECRPTFVLAVEAMGQFDACVRSVARAEAPAQARADVTRALALAVKLRSNVRWLESRARTEAQAGREHLVAEFRRFMLGLGLASMLLVTVVVIVLLRAAAMVLRPIGKLVVASRQLATEELGHQTQVAQVDEFGELAQAYNGLAQRVRTHEAQRMETLTQVSLTLNHELRNAISAIDMKLELVGRKPGQDKSLRSRIQQIQDDLHRMSQTVESLQRIRRIVLTDYLPGVKMLDLAQSVQAEPTETEASLSLADGVART